MLTWALQPPASSPPARWLRATGLQAVYSSPLRRARETAEPVGYATGLAVQVDSRLRERLNWDRTQAFDAFLAEWDRSTEDRDLIHRPAAEPAG
jgi:broad specificity phosphatase PhoE